MNEKLLAGTFRQICSEFACFSHRFTGNSGVRESNYKDLARKNVTILQSRYSFR
jgi:hypothetical protein